MDHGNGKHCAGRAARLALLAMVLALCAVPLLSALPSASLWSDAGMSMLWQPPAEPWTVSGMPLVAGRRFVPMQPAATVQARAVLLLRSGR